LQHGCTTSRGKIYWGVLFDLLLCDTDPVLAGFRTTMKIFETSHSLGSAGGFVVSILLEQCHHPLNLTVSELPSLVLAGTRHIIHVIQYGV